MDSWATHASPSSVKFEDSPAESLLSTPGEMYPSLFGADSSPAATVNPLEMLSPKSFTEEKQSDVAMLSSLTALTQPPATPASGTPEPEKKPVKKRKSWGQVLPEPKTNLPPRYDASAPGNPTTTQYLANNWLGNVPRPKTKRNNAVSSVFSGTAVPLSRRASGSG